MRKNALAVAVASLSALAAQAGTVTTEGSDMVINTKSGLEARTTNGKYAFKIGGRIQLDGNAFNGVINEKEGEDGSDLFFRRARLELEGKYEDWSYVMAYNLTESGSIDLLNTSYNGFGPLTVLTFGQQKENFGLEDTGSSKWITAMERSMPTNTFDTTNTLGVKLSGSTPLITYSVGGFKNSIDGDDNSLDSAFTGRFVVRPIHEETRLVHLGVGVTERDGTFTSLGARLGVRGGESGSLVNRARSSYTGVAEADGLSAWNGELAASFGPYHLMAEYFDGEISGVSAAPDLKANGYYVQAAWILTGESRTYKNDIAAFDKIKPNGMNGAWEVFFRYDTLDLSDNDGVALIATPVGEDADTITCGVNWYANSVVKVSLNYIHAETDAAINDEDNGDAIAARLQFAF